MARVLLLALTTTLLVAGPAVAAEPGDPSLCDATVIVDPASLLTAGEVASIEESATALAISSDAQVHAVLLSDTGGAGIDDWADAQLDVCGSWQREDGESADRLLVLAVSLDDRQTGSYYGIDLAPTLNGERDRVHDRTMAPFLRDGRFADALVQGLEDYQRTLASSSPIVDPVDAVAEPEPAPSTETVTETEPAAPGLPPTPAPRVQDTLREEAEALRAFEEAARDEPVERRAPSGSSDFGLFLLGLLGLGGVGLGGVTVGGRWLSERRRRRALFEEAVSMHATVRSTYYDLTERWSSVHDETVVTLGSLDPTDRLALELSREVDEAEQALERLGGGLTTTSEPVEDETIDELHAVWSSHAESAAETEREVTEVVERLAEIEAARAGLAAAIVAAADQLQRVTARVDAYETGGQDVEHPRAMLAFAASSLDDARAADPVARTGAAIDGVTGATAAADEAEVVADRHAELRASLPGRHVALVQRTAEVDREAPEALGLLTELQRSWARAVWDDLADAAEEYAEHHRRASEVAEHASRLIAENRYDGADELLADVDASIDEMAATLDEVTDRHADVVATVEAWDTTLAAAEVAMAEATDFLAGREMAPVFAQRLEAAQRLRADAHAAWDGADPLAATERAHRAARTATELLESARQDVERRRRQAEAALADVDRHIKRARSYSRTYGYRGSITGMLATYSAVNALLEQGRYDTAIRRATELSREADRVADAVRREHRSAQSSSSSFGGGGFGGGRSSSFSSSSRSSFGGGGSSSSRSSGGSFGGGGSSGW